MDLADASSNLLIRRCPEEDREALLECATRIRCPAGVTVQLAGQMPQLIYFPVSAVFIAMTSTADGDTVESGMIARDAAVGIEAAIGRDVAAADVEVLIPGDAWVIDSAQFVRLVDARRTLREWILKVANRMLTRLMQNAACHARHTVEQRLCRTILEIADRAGMAFPVTHSALARVLGTSRPRASTLIRQLGQRGLIASGRGLFSIKDRPQLLRLACPCYAAQRASDAQLFG
jgi:CRP-like cAMP-binding protein